MYSPFVTHVTAGVQGDDVDEVAHQPAWLQEDGSEDHATADGGAAAAAGVGALSLHERAVSNGAADFIGLDNGVPAAPAAAAAPYANGNGHVSAPPAVAASAAAAGPAPASAPAAPTPARDPLEDLLSLSAAPQAEPPKPGRAICFLQCHEQLLVILGSLRMFRSFCDGVRMWRDAYAGYRHVYPVRRSLNMHVAPIVKRSLLQMFFDWILISEQDWTPTSRLILIIYGCGSACCV